jgi:hypothetical protein
LEPVENGGDVKLLDKLTPAEIEGLAAKLRSAWRVDGIESRWIMFFRECRGAQLRKVFGCITSKATGGESG